MQVFMRAYKNKDLKGKTIDILCPLDGFKIVIDGETCVLTVSIGNRFYMSEPQYNALIFALKNVSISTVKASSVFLNATKI